MRKDVSSMARMHTPITKQDKSGSPSGPVTQYYLPPDELEKFCSSLPPRPTKTNSHATTAYQSKARGLR